MDIYQQKGYNSRQEYLQELADTYGSQVWILAEVLGPNEDFDGLINSIEDYENWEN